ncbi:MAG: hypothetical protein L3J92_05115 [Thermoplasmata archaeon]|nr:hypothetical protein [Thermoplasmata archaeon]
MDTYIETERREVFGPLKVQRGTRARYALYERLGAGQPDRRPGSRIKSWMHRGHLEASAAEAKAHADRDAARAAAATFRLERKVVRTEVRASLALERSDRSWMRGFLNARREAVHTRTHWLQVARVVSGVVGLAIITLVAVSAVWLWSLGPGGAGHAEALTTVTGAGTLLVILGGVLLVTGWFGYRDGDPDDRLEVPSMVILDRTQPDTT